MGVPTSEVGYTPAMPRREDNEVHKGHVVALGKKNILYSNILSLRSALSVGKINSFRISKQEVYGLDSGL